MPRNYPSPWPIVGDTLEEQALIDQPGKSWKDQLVRYVAIQDLLREVVPWVEEKTAGEEEERDTFGDLEGKGEKEEVKGTTFAVVTRCESRFSLSLFPFLESDQFVCYLDRSNGYDGS